VKRLQLNKGEQQGQAATPGVVLWVSKPSPKSRSSVGPTEPHDLSTGDTLSLAHGYRMELTSDF
jgi:hypothetical protein